MDKFSGLYIKTNGEWSLHGKLQENISPLNKQLREITDAQGKISKGKTNIQAEAAAIIHSKKGTVKSRKF